MKNACQFLASISLFLVLCMYTIMPIMTLAQDNEDNPPPSPDCEHNLICDSNCMSAVLSKSCIFKPVEAQGYTTDTQIKVPVNSVKMFGAAYSVHGVDGYPTYRCSKCNEKWIFPEGPYSVYHGANFNNITVSSAKYLATDEPKHKVLFDKITTQAKVSFKPCISTAKTYTNWRPLDSVTLSNRKCDSVLNFSISSIAVNSLAASGDCIVSCNKTPSADILPTNEPSPGKSYYVKSGTEVKLSAGSSGGGWPDGYPEWICHPIPTLSDVMASAKGQNSITITPQAAESVIVASCGIERADGSITRKQFAKSIALFVVNPQTEAEFLIPGTGGIWSDNAGARKTVSISAGKQQPVALKLTAYFNGLSDGNATLTVKSKSNRSYTIFKDEACTNQLLPAGGMMQTCDVELTPGGASDEIASTIVYLVPLAADEEITATLNYGLGAITPSNPGQDKLTIINDCGGCSGNSCSVGAAESSVESVKLNIDLGNSSYGEKGNAFLLKTETLNTTTLSTKNWHVDTLPNVTISTYNTTDIRNGLPKTIYTGVYTSLFEYGLATNTQGAFIKSITIKNYSGTATTGTALVTNTLTLNTDNTNNAVNNLLINTINGSSNNSVKYTLNKQTVAEFGASVVDVWCMTKWSGTDTANAISEYVAKQKSGNKLTEWRYFGSLTNPDYIEKTIKNIITLDDGSVEYDVIEVSTGTMKTSYTYDSQRRLIKQVNPDGSKEEYSYNSTNGMTNQYKRTIGQQTYITNYTYSTSFNPFVTTAITKVGDTITAKSVTSTYYGSTTQPNTTELYYDSNNKLITKTYYVSDKNSPFYGKVSRIDNPNGTVSLYTYLRSGDKQTVTNYNGELQNIADTATIVKGIKTVTETNSKGWLLSTKSYAIDSTVTPNIDMLISSVETAIADFDVFGHPLKVNYLNGRSTSSTYGCCGVTSVTDLAGTTTTYTYNPVNKLAESECVDGITTHYSYNAAGMITAKTVKDDNTGSEITEETTYNKYGQIESVKLQGQATQTTYEHTYTTVNNDNIRYTLKQTNRDGGTVIETYYNGALESITGTAVLNANYTYGPNYTASIRGGITVLTEYNDMLNRKVKTTYADNTSSYDFYNNQGLLTKQVSPSGVVMLFAYDSLARVTKQAIDLNRNDNIEQGDIITEQTYGYGTQPVTLFEPGSTATKNVSILDTYRGNGSVRVLVASEKRAVDGSMEWRTDQAGLTIGTRAEYTGNGEMRYTAVAPTAAKTITLLTNGRITATQDYDSAGVLYNNVIYNYGKFKQVSSITETNGSTTTINSLSNTYDDYLRLASQSLNGQITSYAYDVMDRVSSTTLPGSRTKNSVYYPTGELKMEYGADTYPVQYTYNGIWGGIATMTTWQTGWTAASQTSGNTTSWTYNNRGFMTKKTKADNSAVNYEYNADGNVTKRTWARGVVTNYAYDNAGRLTGKTYSDGTPSVNFTYDALGRQATAGGLTYTYNNKGYLTGIGGMSYYYDAYGRRSSAIHMTSIVEYTYDIRSRLATVSSPSSYYKATYNYNAKNQLAGYAVTSMQAPTTAFYSQVRTFDDYGRLTGIKQETPPTSLQGNGYNETYTYNSANQLTSRSSGRSYTYNAIGELASEVRSEYTTNYIYDLIGNRQTMSVVRTTGTTSTNYTGNNVNRYTAVGSTSYANAYDADGNMVLYNGWTLGWDGENRLKSASKGSTNISYAYDALNRRISETKGTNTTHFTWDGYNLFHEITLTTNGIGAGSEKSYVWGLDLSGTLQGAGGIGGLLWQDDNITHEKSFAFYDNNGNITKYITSNYTLGASYNYDAFLNGSTGTAYRFQASTKSWNNDLGLLDYQFRAYSPTLGRWIQEDPIEEQGGVNLYNFVGNNPVTRWDNLGHYTLAYAKRSLINRGVGADDSMIVLTTPPFNYPAVPTMPKRVVPVYTDKQIFDEWYRLELTNGSWWTVLPQCPPRTCKFNDDYYIVHDAGVNCSQWEKPSEAWTPTYKYHTKDARVELRSKPVSLHSNQCIYVDSKTQTANKKIIYFDLSTKIPIAGTADFKAPGAMLKEAFSNFFEAGDGHQTHDVFPFDLAKKLDGGNAGSHVKKYYDVRPMW